METLVTLGPILLVALAAYAMKKGVEPVVETEKPFFAAVGVFFVIYLTAAFFLHGRVPAMSALDAEIKAQPHPRPLAPRIVEWFRH